MSGSTVDDDAEVEVSRVVHHVPAAVLAAAGVGLLVAAPELGGDRGLAGRRPGAAAGVRRRVGHWPPPAASSSARSCVGAAASVAADLVFVLADRPTVGALLAVLGLALPAAVLRQMFRRPRTALVASLAVSVLMLCAVCALAVLLRDVDDPDAARLTVSALLAVGAALVAAHLVDLVFPRPQVAFGLPRGLLGLVLAVGAAGAVTWLRRRPDELFDALGAAIYGGAVGGVAVLVSLAASYLVVEADRAAGSGRRRSRWALPVIQAVLPIAACAPIALALAYYTSF